MTRTSIQDLVNITPCNASTSSTSDDILVWLDKIDPRDAPPTIDLVEDQDHSFVALKQQVNSFDALPCTPQRHDTQQISAGEYPSPTNTGFTDNSIFDQPFAPGTRYFDTHIDALSYCSATSIVSSDFSNTDSSYKSQIVRSENLAEAKPQNATGVEVANAHNIKSVKRHAPVILQKTEVHLVQPKTVPERCTLVWVTSCLQCTLAKMPCSRTIPACSRCVRSGCGDMCLLQRRKLNSERVLGAIVGNITPVLLHEKGQGGEIIERKRALNAELLKNWQCDMDRKNWVLPSNDGNIGGFRLRGNRRLLVPAHPGEGIGRATPLMVNLA